MAIDPKERLAGLSDEQRQLLAKRLISGRGQAERSIARRRQSGPVPLSFAQQRIWFLNQLQPSNTGWNVGRPIRLRGALDLGALTRALNEMVRRHESLRTVFPVVDGVPAQQVLPYSELRLEVIDLRGLPAGERGAEALGQLAAVHREPWALETGPLFRSRLWRLADDDHVFLVLVHHILADGWAWGLAERELTTLYSAFSAGQPSPLADLPIQYADFAVWQREWVESPACARQLEFWKQQFTELPKTQLVADRGASGAPLSRYLHVPDALTAALRGLCRRENATLFMGLTAAFAALLSRYTGADEVVVGSPIANRNRVELEHLIGCFMNPLPLRVDVSGRPSFVELLRRVRDLSLSVYANQDVPFDLLVRALQPERDPTSPPLFQAMLLLQNWRWEPLSISGRDAEGPTDGASQIALDFDELHTEPVYPVAIEAYEHGPSLVCLFQHEAAFATILARAPEHFQRFLEAATASPDRPIGELSILTDDEQRLVAGDRLAPAVALPLAHRSFEAEAARRPDAVAVTGPGEPLTYGELNARANQLAHHLRALGAGPDSRVAILLRRSPELIVALLAVLKAGAAYVPLDPAYPASRLRFMLDDSATPLVITTAALLEATSGVMPADGRVTVVRIDADAAAIAARDRTTPAVDLAPGDLAYVIYTSGSTGTPKGVQISHGALANYTAVARAAFKLEPSDRVLQFASISFDTAAEEIYPCLAAGASLVLRTDAMIHSVPEFLGTCREQGITVLDLPTAYWHELANDVERHDAALPASVRLVILGGERARPDVARAWQARFGRRVRLLNTYGPTEATIVTTMIDVPADAFDVDLQDVSIGRAIPRARVYILDRHLRPATIGAPGELCIGGAGLARGYLNRPDLTADRFVPDPFAADPGGRLYRTGDLARYLGDGTIEFLGRIDQQIKLRGHRIELTEIETALTDDAAVQDAVVVLRDEGTAGARLAAYVVARGASLSTSELRQRLRDRLPEYMIPSAFVRLESLPLTPSGKIDRDALPAPQIDRPSSEPYAAPQTELQNTLASLWRDLLAVDRVGIDDNFFDLGGHSLLVLQLHSRLRALFHDAPSVVDLFRFSTVRLLAAHLAAGQNDDSSAAASSDLARERASRQREAFRRRREAAQAGVAEAVE